MIGYVNLVGMYGNPQ